MLFFEITVFLILKKYTYLGHSDGRRFCIEGINVFAEKWRSQGSCDIVLQPDTNKPYSFSVYTIEKKDKTITFLAGHFEDESWAFYKELGDDDFII